MLRPTRSTIVSILLISAAALAMTLAYRWFEARYVQDFDQQAAEFAGAQLQLPAELAGAGAIHVVHFWDPACPCNAINQQHVAQLFEHYAERGVAFYLLQRPGSQGRLPETLQRLTALAELPGSEHVPASPAVAIWDQSGQLAYFGPYSEGLVCNASNSFIEPILQALLDGRQVLAGNTLAYGCFCNWSAPDTL